jgi:hypothetical protein
MKKLQGPGRAVVCLLAGMGILFECSSPVQNDPPKSEGVFRPVFSASAGEVRDFVSAGQGGQHAKLVFVDRTKAEDALCYVDFSESGPDLTIHTIASATKPAVPVISPDGNWVTYASGNGAEAGSAVNQRSSVYLCRLEEGAVPVLVAKDSACEPRFVQNNPGRLSIIYATLAPNFGWEGFGRTMRVDFELAGDAVVPGSPQEVWPSGSYTGGMSWDGRYLCGGGGHVAMLDMSAQGAKPETLSYNGVQSCNASISSSTAFTNTMMYLTLGGSNPSINGGKAWTTWQAILIGNYARQLVRGYMVPTSYEFPIETDPASFSGVKWHHCEWSNHPYFAAATVNVDRFFKVGDGYANTLYQERLYLINLRDSTYCEVLRPDAVRFSGKSDDAAGYYWPWLWVEIPAGFGEDPAWLQAR